VFEAAVASRSPALIEVVTDPDAISPTTTIGALREAASHLF